MADTQVVSSRQPKETLKTEIVGNGLKASVRDTGSSDSLNVAIVDASGNQITSFGGSGGTAQADDAAFTIASDNVTPVGYLADDTTPDSVDEGDVGVARMTLTRKPYAVITDATSENNAGVDGSGHLQVDIAADSVGIGGGTQYTEGDTDATITGTAAMMEVAADTLQPVQGTVADGLLVNLGSNNDVTVTGTVDLGATDNAVLDQIEVNTGYGEVTVGGAEATALRVTIANDSTGVLSVDDNGSTLSIDDGAGSITVDNAGTLPYKSTVTL